ncbi:SGNH hydrolase-type esterase domain-containing protein [Calycina marina]|uniref:SGNH hydrolase-type esterase domain-containing protein n=1 Tax=Calycina marina TaxID=1763456 RepID=A0A9P7YVA0_9HELO|nr:SGNH hydrolase-type esterase domain-containing protein [Calycina marina]
MQIILKAILSVTASIVFLAAGGISAQPNNTYIRILPIGDSITWGYGSTSGNGYRLNLRKLLAGSNVTYHGHYRSGTMANNNNEGYSGKLIAEIETYVRGNGTLAEGPNIILLLAGTNDINIDHKSTTAPEGLDSLIDLVTTSCDDAAVIVSEIIPIGGVEQEARVQIYNAAISRIVAMRTGSAGGGKPILVLNMSDYVIAADLGDGLHPTDEGYQKMADGWLDGIKQVVKKGWLNANISDSVSVTSDGSTTAVLSISGEPATQISLGLNIEAELGRSVLAFVVVMGLGSVL